MLALQPGLNATDVTGDVSLENLGSLLLLRSGRQEDLILLFR